MKPYCMLLAAALSGCAEMALDEMGEADMATIDEWTGEERLNQIAQSLSPELREHWVPSHRNGQEASVDMPQHYALTAIGARVHDDAVTTLHLRGQVLAAYGRLGATRLFRGGSAPNSGLEVWCSAPTNHLIVGLGARIADRGVGTDENMTTLHIWHRRYDPSRRRLVGDVALRRCGSEPNSGLEQQFHAWDSVNPEVEDLTVINGVGMWERDENLHALRVRTRSIE